nr:MAG TPA: hypothetical protein [Caudoviricetes sp.]
MTPCDTLRMVDRVLALSIGSAKEERSKKWKNY